MNIAEIGKQIGEQVAKEPLICWYPGGFKPPHKGHFAAAQQLAAKPYITQVNVLIGKGIRDGITAEQSKAIWDLYLKAQPNPKIKVEIANTPSPIKDIYRWFANDLERKAYVAAAGKEANDLKYFEGLKEAFGDRVFEEIINDEFTDTDGERVSGTEFRATINRLRKTYNLVKADPNDKKALNDYNTTYNYFKSLFPESVINKGYFDEIQKVLGINYPPPTSLQEGDQPNPKNQPKWVWLEYKNQNKLNPLIFGDDEEVDEDVKDLLLKIANYFWEGLEIPEPFEDVILTGSSVNYNYTPTSDIDLHIAVDFSKFDNPELIKKFFDEAKVNWNRVHDLKLGKHNIEVYIQDINDHPEYRGEYSLMKNEWLNKPSYEKINVPNSEIEKKAKIFKQQINKLVKQGKDNPQESIELINKIKERLTNFRQAGLDKDGEYSIENLAFKNLRNTGYLKKLSDLKNQLIDKSLSLTESIDKNSLFDNFMSYACNELQIETPPTFEIKHMVGEEQPSFGAYVPSDHHIFINPVGRNVVDILRTLAHELVHAKQNELGILRPDSGETGSDHENDANAIAGILMRDYGKQNPDIYRIGVLNEMVTKTSVICDKCGWKWKKKDGGKDLYMCHKCGHNNTPTLNEEEKPKKRVPITRVYLDMDGVIAGFDDQFKKYNKEGLDFKSYMKEYSSNKAWDIINKAGHKFWASMSWNPGGKQLYDHIMSRAKDKNYEVWILSSPGLDPNGDAKKGKNEWLDKHTNIPQERRVFKQAKDKHTEAKPGYLLIDDMGKNVSEFIQAGGTGIKNNPENSTESIKKLYRLGL
jgi:predicted nucleotidyltransferase